jgi:RNA polymerase sigma-70 factor (sigma-E family)
VNETIKRPGVPSANSDAGEGFPAFYRREHAAALRLAWLLTGSQAAAEDVVQEAMTRVYGAYDRIESPAAYLRRVVVNTARSGQRDERRRQDRVRRQEPAWRSVDPSDGELLELVRQLPYRQRVVIVTRYWGGWSEKEIALALGCRPGTVKSLASRALDRLRAEVAP